MEKYVELTPVRKGSEDDWINIHTSEQGASARTEKART